MSGSDLQLWVSMTHSDAPAFQGVADPQVIHIKSSSPHVAVVATRRCAGIDDIRIHVDSIVIGNSAATSHQVLAHATLASTLASPSVSAESRPTGFTSSGDGSEPATPRKPASSSISPTEPQRLIDEHLAVPIPPVQTEIDVLQPSVNLLLSNPGPLAWPEPLLDFQAIGVRALVARDRLLLADDMGLGKTIQAIAALRVLVMRSEIASVLIVLPASLLTQWRREIRRWAPELRTSTVHGPAQDRAWQWQARVHVHLTSYETLRADFTENESARVARQWDLVVLDEGQKIRNPDADVSQVCKQLKRKRQWLLSGTPLENSIDDLLSLLEFVDPIGGHSTPRLPLRDRLIDVQLRRRKSEVLTQLPPKRITRMDLELTAAQRRTYDRVEKEGILELRQLGTTIQITHVLELIGRLKQICNFCPSTGQSSKFDDLNERVHSLQAEGHKALVFSQFTNDAYGVRAIASRLGSRSLVFTGDQQQFERDYTVRRFREDPEKTTLVLSLRAGGQGLNLQEASYVFHFDRWWNPALEAQAEARSHRMGQRHPVNVYTYICKDTIEERIDAVLAEKQVLFDDLVDGVSLNVERYLSQDDLFRLFNLTPPPRPR